MQFPQLHGRKRSFVRFISSFLLPLRPAPRIFFHAVKNPSCAFEGIDVCHNGETPHISTHSQGVMHFNRSGGSAKPDLLEFGHESNQKELDDGIVNQKLDNLEKELQELRHQMARIMETQLKPDLRPPSFNIMATPQSSLLQVPQAPAPPPPPPPPMPPIGSVPSTRLVINRVEKPVHTSTPKRPGLAINMANVLKDLDKVKLRHVERSPGGTPLRQPPPPTDPNTMLLVALKKRYAVMHDKTPEKSMLGKEMCNLSDSSFTEDSPFLSTLIKC